MALNCTHRLFFYFPSLVIIFWKQFYVCAVPLYITWFTVGYCFTMGTAGRFGTVVTHWRGFCEFVLDDLCDSQLVKCGTFVLQTAAFGLQMKSYMCSGLAFSCKLTAHCEEAAGTCLANRFLVMNSLHMSVKFTRRGQWEEKIHSVFTFTFKQK